MWSCNDMRLPNRPVFARCMVPEIYESFGGFAAQGCSLPSTRLSINSVSRARACRPCVLNGFCLLDYSLSALSIFRPLRRTRPSTPLSLERCPPMLRSHMATEHSPILLPLTSRSVFRASAEETLCGHSFRLDTPCDGCAIQGDY